MREARRPRKYKSGSGFLKWQSHMINRLMFENSSVVVKTPDKATRAVNECQLTSPNSDSKNIPVVGRMMRPVHMMSPTKRPNQSSNETNIGLVDWSGDDGRLTLILTSGVLAGLGGTTGLEGLRS